ncbi:MAG: serine/threonine-protein kinase [Byssovorax sp.]
MSELTGSIGLVLGDRYRLETLIGRGGMGCVWRAEHLTLGTPVALKLLSPALAAQPGVQARFLKEARAAARLRSANVVQVLDHGVHDGIPFIAMECLEGESLAARITREGALSPAATARVLTGVCRALSYAHRLGVVHRDLKPDNIFIARDEAGPLVKVLDFGVAKVMESLLDPLAKPESGATKTGEVLGTPRYMSPEQARGKKTVDARADLWSLGVIAFLCLTGEHPFDAPEFGVLVLKICADPVPVPSSIREVPAGFDAFIARALERDPADRFQTIGELADALADILTPGQRWLDPSGDGDLPSSRERPSIEVVPASAAPVSPAARVEPPPPAAPVIVPATAPAPAPQRARWPAVVALIALAAGLLALLLRALR